VLWYQVFVDRIDSFEIGGRKVTEEEVEDRDSVAGGVDDMIFHCGVFVELATMVNGCFVFLGA